MTAATSPSRAGEVLPVATANLASFDGSVRLRQEVVRPDRYRQLETVEPGRRRISRGGGYSYAAAGFGAEGSLVQDGRAFDRVLAFDEGSGVLECEAGTTLGRIHDVAASRGWYLPVQPGYPGITVGGCIAADVHGKNQFGDGNFHAIVAGLRLFHPQHGILDADPARHAELFDLTCGGFGLTGHIVSARLRLARLPGRRVRVRVVAIPRFEDTLALLEEHAPESSFIYTWHDFTARGGAFGRGFLYAGTFVPGDSNSGPAENRRVVAIDAESRGRRMVPFFNGFTTRAFNSAYFRAESWMRRERDLDLFSFLFPVARKVVYFDLFGAAGFREYQVLVPRDRFRELASALRTFFAGNALPVTLASCKLFRGHPRYLRFDGDGLCLAVDVPNGPSSRRLGSFMDGLVRELGGRPNLIKDSRLPREVARACYPEYEAFRAGLRRFDPRRLFASELSERLDL
jgi:decaprenylphospho-beta-D-ribofuranose 2-oxidase